MRSSFLSGEGRNPVLPWAPAFAGVTGILMWVLVRRRQMRSSLGEYAGVDLGSWSKLRAYFTRMQKRRASQEH
jgi:hypothetical protein